MKQYTKPHIRTIMTTCMIALTLIIHIAMPKCNCHTHMIASAEEVINNASSEPTSYISYIDAEVDDEPFEVNTEPVNYVASKPIDVEEVDVEQQEPEHGLTREWITVYSDIVVPTCPSVEDLDALIDYWHPRILNGEGTRFKGYGWAFHKAWEETGIDPLVIFGIAAWESGWGNSQIAIDKNNFYGIAAFDYDPYNCAKDLGDSIGEGIINGAKWIKENYYDKGYTSMYSININGYNPSLAWSDKIVNSMINSHYKVMQTKILNNKEEI